MHQSLEIKEDLIPLFTYLMPSAVFVNSFKEKLLKDLQNWKVVCNLFVKSLKQTALFYTYIRTYIPNFIKYFATDYLLNYYTNLF